MEGTRPATAIIALVAGGVLMLTACAGTPKELSETEVWGVFVGAWANTEYSGAPSYPQKLMLKPELSVDEYSVASDSAPKWAFVVRPRKHWVDAQGAICCRVSWEYTTEPPAVASTGWVPPGQKAQGLSLFRVAKDGSVLEVASIRGPTEGSKAAQGVLKYLGNIDPGLRQRMAADSALFAGEYRIYRRM